MQALLNSGKYKVMEVLHSDSLYDVCLCTDVMVNTGDMFIVNTYKDRQVINEFLPMFFALSKNGMKDFRALITSDGRISAVFSYHKGIPFSKYYKKKKGVKPDYHESVAIAENLLMNALELDLADDRIACCVLSEDNIMIDAAGRSVGLNCHIVPFVKAEQGFRGKRLGGMLRKMFPENRYLPAEIEQFIEELNEGKYPSCTSVYSRWREVMESAEKTRATYEKESFTKYLLRRAKEKKQKRKKQR